MDVLQRLGQRVQGELELAHGGVPEVVAVLFLLVFLGSASVLSAATGPSAVGTVLTHDRGLGHADIGAAHVRVGKGYRAGYGPVCGQDGGQVELL